MGDIVIANEAWQDVGHMILELNLMYWLSTIKSKAVCGKRCSCICQRQKRAGA